MSLNARVQGWAQRRVTSVIPLGFNAALNGIAGSGVSPVTTGAPSRQAAAVAVAGTPMSIRWGFDDPNNILGTSLPLNVVEAEMMLFYDVSSDILEIGASDSVSYTVPALLPPTSLDRTFTFTPTHTGTVRIYVHLKVMTGTNPAVVFTELNTDGGSVWGGSTETLPNLVSDVDSCPGLIVLGTDLNSVTLTGTRVGGTQYAGDSYRVEVSLAHTQRVSLESGSWDYILGEIYGKEGALYQDGVTWQFEPLLSPAVGTYVPVTEGNLMPDAFAPDILASCYTQSHLSVERGGASIPFMFFSSVPAGYISPTAPDASGATPTYFSDDAGVDTTKFCIVWYTQSEILDPRIKVHCHTQKSSVLSKDTPPTFVDDTTFVSGTDTVYVWGRVSNMNGDVLSGVDVRLHIDDPSEAAPNHGAYSFDADDNFFTLGNTDATGWTTSSASLAIGSTGTWHVYSTRCIYQGHIYASLYQGIIQDDNKDTSATWSFTNDANSDVEQIKKITA